MTAKFQMDKFLHYTVVFAITFFGSILLGPAIAILSALAIAVGKELYDEFFYRYFGEGSGWSWGDLIADASGLVAGLLSFAALWWYLA